MKRLILSSVLFASQALHAEPLTVPQLAAEATFLVLMGVDHGQTRQIEHHCDNRTNCSVHETNPILTSKPSSCHVRNYFLAASVVHVVITQLLPSEYRAAWLTGSIAVEAIVIGRNKRLGLRVQF